MRDRLYLHELLCKALGSRHVYFQPPASVKMVYPAIVYSRNSIDNDYANDGVYMQSPSYTVTVIDKDPDSPIVGRISLLRSCRFNRHYAKDGVNHDVFTIYI